MPTIASGETVSVYAPIASTITVTPSAGAAVSVIGGNVVTRAPVEHRVILSVATISLSAWDRVSITATNGSATYTNPVGLDTSLQSLVLGAGFPGHAAPKNRIVKRGSKLLDVVSNASFDWTPINSNVVTVSGEFTRRNSFTRKIDMTSSTGNATYYWADATGVVCDPTDQLISVDVYIDDIFQPSFGDAFAIVFTIANASNGTGPSTTWTFNNNYLRQGWNTITMCGKDADGSSGGFIGAGTLPFGVFKSNASGGLDWSQPLKSIVFSFQCSTARKRVFWMDEFRIPAKIKPFVCLGFDAAGSSNNDDIFVTRTAPFLAARHAPCYFTNTWIYDGVNQGAGDDARRDTLYSTWGWDSINHTWSHGATVPGTTFSGGNTLTISGGNLATLVLSGVHGWTVGQQVFVAVGGATGASSANANGVFQATVLNTTTVTYPVTGGVNGVATGTIIASTLLNSVYTTKVDNFIPIVLPAAIAQESLRHEVQDIQIGYAWPKGFIRGATVLAYPNNSVPDMKLMIPVCAAAGVKIARGIIGTTVKVSEYGIDNPLSVGSVGMGSNSLAVGGTRVSDMINAINGAVNRGEGLFIFGHFLQDETLVTRVTIGSPPGMDGNPAAPGAAEFSGLWWYAGDFETLVNYCVTLRNAGQLDLVSASDLVRQIGV